MVPEVDFVAIRDNPNAGIISTIFIQPQETS
jgi:hypothetical protein